MQKCSDLRDWQPLFLVYHDEKHLSVPAAGDRRFDPKRAGSPNTNAFVERFIQSIQQECLDRFVIFGEQHLDAVCQEFLVYYHEERPHQSLENDPLNKPQKRGRPKTKRGKIEEEVISLSEVRCEKRLGGLLKSYSRRAA